MKNIMLITALLCGTMLAAQQPQKDTERRPQRSDNFRETLKLTDDQYMKITEIRSQYRKRIDELRNSPDKNSNREAFQSVREKRDAEIGAVLTQEQREKWNTLKQERRQRGAAHRKDGARDIKSKLNLNDEQAEGMKKARKEFHEQSFKIRKDTTMSREARQKEFQRLNQDYNEKVKSALTESQYEQWLAARKEMRKNGHKMMHKRRHHKGGNPDKGEKHNKGDKPGKDWKQKK